LADIAKAQLAANQDLKGLYGTNEGSAIGIVNAANELGLEPGALTIVGFDSGQAQIDAIKNGLMAGAITPGPDRHWPLHRRLRGQGHQWQELPEKIDTGSYWYDQSNIDDLPGGRRVRPAGVAARRDAARCAPPPPTRGASRTRGRPPA
jgi:ribose transport system substrate-binding protein